MRVQVTLYDSTHVSAPLSLLLENTLTHVLASEQDPHVQDIARGYFAALRGRGEIDTARTPWASTANALLRASYFNEGVREARRRLREIRGRG